MKIMKNFSCLLFFAGITLLVSCKTETPTPSANDAKKVVSVQVPDFNADSSYSFVAAQTNFGPRVPGSKAHSQCADYLVSKLKEYNAQVVVQEFKARAFDQTELNGKNIVGSYNPESKVRVLLCAHWDSRPFADNDPDIKNHYKPIDGANDGASGVGVLLELARQFSILKPTIGIDIVFFDLEDYGQHQSSNLPKVEDSWGLGAQYWSKQPHTPAYNAKYGILLDMVGAKNPTFNKEYYSLQYASSIIDKVWFAAAQLGYGANFLNESDGPVTDDHYYININASIPTIDIIHYMKGSQSGFYPYWHTVKDKLDQIDPQSLKIVGQTLLQVLYNES